MNLYNSSAMFSRADGPQFLRPSSVFILSFVRGLVFRYFAFWVLRYFLDAASVAGGLFLSSSLAAAFLNVPWLSFYHVSVVAAAGCLWLLSVYIRALPRAPAAQYVIKEHEKAHPFLGDAVACAYSLIVSASVEDGSDSSLLADAHIERAARALAMTRASGSVKFGGWKKTAGLAAIIAALALFRAAFPLKFRAAATALRLSYLGEEVMRVSPGSTEVIFGDPVAIEAALDEAAAARPVLRISRAGGYSDAALSSSVSDGKIKWRREFPAVYEDIKYHFALGSARTKEYRVKVERPAVFGKFAVRYEYPAYTSAPPRSTEDNPNVDCPAGTIVEITAESLRAVESAAMAGPWGIFHMRLDSGGRRASARFKAERSGTYRFITYAGDRRFLSPDYRIDVKSDEVPVVEILSPARDLEAAGDEKIPVVFICQDDFGVASASFHVYSGEFSDEIKLGAPPQEHKKGGWVSEYVLDLKKIPPNPSGAIKYSVSARDASGGVGRSRIYAVEIVSYEKSHAEVMSELDAFAAVAAELLGEQMTAREDARRSRRPPWENLAAAQSRIKERTDKLADSLGRTLDKMAADPYFDGYLMKEYSGMKSDLSALAAGAMNEAVSAAGAADATKLERAQSEAVAALENIALLSSDVMKYQRHADIESDFLAIERRFDSALEASSAGDFSALSAELDEIGRLMDEIEKLMRDMPHLLPEEFVNSAAARETDFPSARSALDEVRRAAAAGDAAAAARLMSGLKSELARLRDSLKKASENLAARGRPAEAAREMSRVSGALGEIVRAQAELLAASERLAAGRAARSLKEQDARLAELAARQDAVLSAGRTLAATVPAAAASVPLMEKVRDELSAGKVRHSQKFLDDIVGQYEILLKRLEAPQQSASRESDISSARGIMNSEKEIAATLKNPPVAPLTDREKKTSAELAARQDALSGRLTSARASLTAAAKTTASVPYETISSLSEALGEMSLSSERLRDFSPENSAPHQKRVIEILSDSQGNLSSSAQELQGTPFGSRPAPSLRPSGASPSTGGAGAGFAGARVEKVELPSAADYKAPAQFREEILKYLKEKHPAAHNELIKKYYRRLVE